MIIFSQCFTLKTYPSKLSFTVHSLTFHYQGSIIFQIQMTSVSIQRSLEAAQPLLIFITNKDVTLPKTTYAVYYQNHTNTHRPFKNIDHLQELFLPHHQLTFKIVNFQQRTPPVLIHSHLFQIDNNTVTIEAKTEGHRIRLEGTVLNKSQSGQGVVDLSLSSKEGYDDFYKSRKKYKTLQNITKRIEFKIDHRVRLKTQFKQYRFDLEQRKKQHYYLNLASFQRPLTFLLEEITSIEEYSQADIIEEAEVNLQDLTQLQNGYTATITFANLLSLHFLFDLINNDNLANSELVSIRVFESSTPSHQLKIGNEHTINLNNVLTLKPILEKHYYDYEWGYLNQNLNKVEGNQQVYQHLDKISKSSNEYPHLVNQQILDLRDSTHLIFQVDSSKFTIPLVYVMQGLNYIQNQVGSIKYYIDSVHSRIESLGTDYGSDHKRTYQMCIYSWINIGKMNNVLDRQGSDSFILKVMNEDVSYFIPFQRSIAKKSQFKKQAKQLTTKQEIHVLHNNTHYWLQPSPKNRDQLLLISTNAILPFYLVQMTSSTSLSFQITVNNQIHLEGSLLKHKVVNSQGKPFFHLMAALEGNTRIGVSLSFVEVKQVNESVSTYYRFKQRLCFAEPGQTQDVAYDVQLQFEKGSKHKNMRAKLSPELMHEPNEGIFLRDFRDNSGVLCKQNHLNFILKFRKMFYNEELNYFDNQILKEKKIAINPGADVIKEGKSLMIRLQDQCYQSLEIDLYDANIQKRMKYYLEIYAEKNQFLDHRDSSYKIKIPEVLWEYSTPCTNTQPSNYELITHLNRKNKNSDSKSFPQKYQQQFILNHHNYNDGISLIKDQKDISYSKFIRAIKLRCDVVKNKVGWSPQSDWYLAVMTLANCNFYFMVQRMFDAYEDKGRADSNESRRTVSRQLSHRSDKHKVDPLAKTISNLDLHKLKQKKNQIQAEGRQLTTRYVKRTQKIIEITKKIEQLQEKTRQREKEETERKAGTKEVKKENSKMKQFYRSICQCGERDPEFNGYCKNCLTKLKQRYEAFSKTYKEKCYQYETMVFEEYNQKQKIERMKRRVQALKNQDIVVDSEEGSNADYLMATLEEKSLRKAIEDLKVEVFQLEQEKSSLLENSNWQMQVLEQKISQQDSEIYKFSQEYDSLKNKLADLKKLIQKE